MKDTIAANILYFIVAFFSFWIILPSISRFIFRIRTEFHMMSRIKRIKLNEGGYEEEEEAEAESIGLSKKSGAQLSDIPLINYIVESNQELVDEMKILLEKAGMRQAHAMEEFLKSKIIAGIALFFILFLLFGTNDFGIPFAAVIPLSLIIGVAGGHKLTNLNLEMIAKKRREAIEHGVPDLVDLMVICAESGLDLNRSIQRIAREMRTSNEVLADELSLTAIELEMIPDHKQVFTNLENRTDCLEIKTLSKTLSQSIEYGSSLAVSLRDLAVESRQKRMLDAEARAAQAPTLLTLPMMFFIMPCLFIVMLGPVIVGMINSFSGGS